MAGLFFVLAGPALASPRHPTPAQWRDIHKYSKAAAYCANHRTGEEGGEVGETKTNCDTADRLEKKLVPQGFCTVGKGGIGRAGKPFTQKEWERASNSLSTVPKGERHCYTIHDPSIPARFHQH